MCYPLLYKVATFSRTSTFHVARLLLLGACTVLVGIQVASAQRYPVTVSENPGTYDDGDTISLNFSVGTASEPVEDVTSLSVTFVPEGYTIDPASSINLDLSSSWFGNSTNTSTQVVISETGDSLTITLTRTDDQLVGGYGTFVLGCCVIVQIEEIIVKQAAPVQPFNMYPVPAVDKLILADLTPDHAYDVQVLSTDGRVQMSTVLQGASSYPLDLRRLPSGMYLLSFVSETGHVITRRFPIERR